MTTSLEPLKTNEHYDIKVTTSTALLWLLRHKIISAAVKGKGKLAYHVGRQPPLSVQPITLRSFSWFVAQAMPEDVERPTTRHRWKGRRRHEERDYSVKQEIPNMRDNKW